MPHEKATEGLEVRRCPTRSARLPRSRQLFPSVECSAGRRVYDEAVKQALIVVGEAADRIDKASQGGSPGKGRGARDPGLLRVPPGPLEVAQDEQSPRADPVVVPPVDTRGVKLPRRGVSPDVVRPRGPGTWRACGGVRSGIWISHGCGRRTRTESHKRGNNIMGPIPSHSGEGTEEH